MIEIFEDLHLIFDKFIAIITAYTACLEHAVYSGTVYVVLSIYI